MVQFASRDATGLVFLARWLLRAEPASGVVAPRADLARREAALARCTDQIEWDSQHSKVEWRLFVLFQSAAIALVAATPVLVPLSSLPKAVQDRKSVV